jgi:hypothetical protein
VYIRQVNAMNCVSAQVYLRLIVHNLDTVEINCFPSLEMLVEPMLTQLLSVMNETVITNEPISTPNVSDVI